MRRTRLFGKSEIPEIGLFAYCRDTEGNRFCVIQPKMDMK
jgi:predicted enzyme related to lactoylglutathione lyase